MKNKVKFNFLANEMINLLSDEDIFMIDFLKTYTIDFDNIVKEKQNNRDIINAMTGIKKTIRCERLKYDKKIPKIEFIINRTLTCECCKFCDEKEKRENDFELKYENECQLDTPEYEHSFRCKTCINRLRSLYRYIENKNMEYFHVDFNLIPDELLQLKVKINLIQSKLYNYKLKNK